MLVWLAGFRSLGLTLLTPAGSVTESSLTRSVGPASGTPPAQPVGERDLIEARARSPVTGLSVDRLCVPSTTHEGMAILTMADLEVLVTGGVDTHKDTHVAAALDQLGRLLGTEAFPRHRSRLSVTARLARSLRSTRSRSASRAPVRGAPVLPVILTVGR